MQKIKKAEIAENNCAAIAATNAADVSKQMTLGNLLWRNSRILRTITR